MPIRLSMVFTRDLLKIMTRFVFILSTYALQVVSPSPPYSPIIALDSTIVITDADSDEQCGEAANQIDFFTLPRGDISNEVGKPGAGTTAIPAFTVAAGLL